MGPNRLVLRLAIIRAAGRRVVIRDPGGRQCRPGTISGGLLSPLRVLLVWITQPEAATILGVHPETVAKMVACGDLTFADTRGLLCSLDRDEVLALAGARKEGAECRQRDRQAATSRRLVRTERSPDAEHVWLRTRGAAQFVGRLAACYLSAGPPRSTPSC